MYSMLEEIQNQNPEKFNEDFIYLKDKDDILKHINSIFQALEVINGVEFLGSKINRDESKIIPYIKDGKNIVNVEESRFVTIDFSFKITGIDKGKKSKTKGEVKTKIIEKTLFFPKLIDKTYFILNGSKFYPIYQIIDSATYNNGNSLTLKTLLMPIVIRTKKIEGYYDIEDNEYTTPIKVIDLFKNKINYLLYFLAQKGYKETMEYIVGEDWEDRVVMADFDEIDIEGTLKDYIIFGIGPDGSTALCIDRTLNEEKPSLVMNIVDILKDVNEAQANDKQHWILELGKIFSRNKNNYESKALDILTSFKRILDNSTKETLRLRPENKEDIFAIIRWMTDNFEELIQRDNMDLKYKRIRVNEYLCYDLLIKMSNSTYRLLNKPEISLKDREQLFSTLGPMFIVKKIGTNELLRYMGGVNEINLFNPSLKWSARGFQGLGEGSRDVNKSYRGIHPSYIGRIGLTASSNGDPGLTGTFSPFMENHGFYFTDDMLD